MRRPTTAVFATLVTAGGLVVGLPAASGAAGETCRGKPVTLLVENQKTASGTAGDDVVLIRVSRGLQVKVTTGAGDDTVCIVGPVGMDLDTGDGTDVVDATAQTSYSGDGGSPVIQLGWGSDTFFGSPDQDLVEDSPESGTPPGPDDDVIDTGDGIDLIESFHGSDRLSAGAGDDRVTGAAVGRVPVDLGDGDDEIDVTGPVSQPLTGGPGDDTLQVVTGPAPAAIDNVAETLTIGSTTTSATSFAHFAVEVGESLAFRGSDQPEELRVVRSFDRVRAEMTALRPVDADLGAGDDELEVESGIVGSWDGGPGRDSLEAIRANRVPSSPTRPSIDLDLAAGVVRVRANGRARVASYEKVETINYRTDAATGSRAAESIVLGGCRSSVDAGGGDDRVALTDESCANGERTGVVHGGRGDDRIAGDIGADRMYGGPGADRLHGAGGTDLADGGPGRDRCSAERRVACETRPPGR